MIKSSIPALRNHVNKNRPYISNENMQISIIKSIKKPRKMLFRGKPDYPTRGKRDYPKK